MNFDYDPASYDNDIALLQLDEAVELTPRVRPVCLPTDRSARVHLQEGKLGVVSARTTMLVLCLARNEAWQTRRT